MKKTSKAHVTKSEAFLLFSSILASILISYGFHLLIWITFVPLLYIAFLKSAKKTLIFSIIYGITTSIFFFNWVYDIKLNYDIELYIIIISTFTIYFALFLTLTSFLSKKIKSNYKFLLPPVIWIVLLFIYTLLPIKIYWNDFALFQPDTAPLIWYLGSYGITYIILLFNAIIAFYFVERSKNMIILASLLAAIIFASIFYSNISEFISDKNLKIALLQGNFPYSWDWRQENAFGLLLDTYTSMTFEAAKEKPEIIIWPEYSIPQDFTKNKTIISKIQKLSQQAETAIILGTLTYVDTKDKHKDTAMVFLQNGSYYAYDSLKPFFLDNDAVSGNEKKIINLNGQRLGIIMCNEEITPEIPRHYSKNSNFLVSMSNNQDFGRGRVIIAQFTRLRAAENAKYLLRATNDGITQIINPFGKVVYSSEPKKQNILIGNIYLNDYKTFYTKYGNVLLHLIMVLSIILLFKKR